MPITLSSKELSSMPTGDPSNFDDQLITIDEYAELKPSNHISSGDEDEE